MLIEEYKKCLEDPIYFIEKHCLINNKPIKLKDYQKAFIKYVSRSKKNRKILDIDIHKNNSTLLYCL